MMFLSDTYLLTFAIFAGVCFKSCTGHGRMIFPPSRQSGFRFGIPTPINYNDNELNCGGRENQRDQAGRCGICGDPFQGPRRYERPDGSLVSKKPIITNRQKFEKGIVIQIEIEITAPHKGFNEFRLCDTAQTDGVEATQECLDQNVLPDESGKTRFYLPNVRGFYTYYLKLPEDIECTYCVLQWWWEAGNNPPSMQQENFYACSDISILPSSGTATRQPNPRPSPTSVRVVTQKPTTRTPAPSSSKRPTRAPTRAPTQKPTTTLQVPDSPNIDTNIHDYIINVLRNSSNSNYKVVEFRNGAISTKQKPRLLEKKDSPETKQNNILDSILNGSFNFVKN